MFLGCKGRTGQQVSTGDTAVDAQGGGNNIVFQSVIYSGGRDITSEICKRLFADQRDQKRLLHSGLRGILR